MEIEFFKYHGAGNDFVMVDCRQVDEHLFDNIKVGFLCNRHLGIGADGLILLLDDPSAEFRMKYFNSDGREGTMCGNGGRCIVAFARDLGIIHQKTVFSGIDGLHHSEIMDSGLINLKMIDVDGVKEMEDGYLVETGSRHFVTFRKSISDIDVFSEGREIRQQARFADEGTNVNFVETVSENVFKIRTFERGVENETLACGTGAVASAISSHYRQKTDKNSYTIHALGGTLSVNFTVQNNENYSNIWLKGPAKFVFKGQINI